MLCKILVSCNVLMLIQTSFDKCGGKIFKYPGRGYIEKYLVTY